MSNKTLIGPWVRRYLLEYLVTDRNCARNTQTSYRDTLVLLLPFLSKSVNKDIDKLLIEDLSPAEVRLFLTYVEEDRKCGVPTRNLRLAMIHSFAKYIANHSPEHIAWCAQVRVVPFKKTISSTLSYLEKSEIDALLAAPDQGTPFGRRDYALLLFLYNTGARVSEATHLSVDDISWGTSPAVRLLGKGRKTRWCPIWAQTEEVLKVLTSGYATKSAVFLNRVGQPLTRFGVYGMVRRMAKLASDTIPSITSKNISPHCLRHSCAVHLLRSGVDINTIRAWLGHVSLDTTNIYAEVDFEMKAKALSLCDLPDDAAPKLWHTDKETMAFLKNL